MRQYKVIDLSYTDDPALHLAEVGAYHEGDGWRLLSVVYARGRWLYYLEREAEGAGARAGVDRDAAGSASRGQQRAARGTLDYITAGLARFREVAEAGGFEVGEVTLSFDEVEDKALLKVSLGVDPSLLEPEPAASPTPPRPLRCFNCEEEGHGAADCPHPDRDDEPEVEESAGPS